MPLFQDRSDAGRRLAAEMGEIELHRPVVVALPRGGVPVAAEVAATLGAPLEVYVARKVGAPGHPELGIGAVGETPSGRHDDPVIVRPMSVWPATFDALAQPELEEVGRRVRRYRGDRELPPLDDRDVVIVDDGMATGVTAEAAAIGLRRLDPRSIVLGVPVCARGAVDRLRRVVDRVVCVSEPSSFGAVGNFYLDFRQTSDDEVLTTIARAATAAGAGPAADGEAER